MRRAILLFILFLLLLAVPVGVRYARYNDLGAAQAEPPPDYDPGEVPLVPTPPANDFVDEPVVAGGRVLLDQAHENDFEPNEISYLDGRLAARGAELLAYTGGDLAGALRSANAFVVIAPMTAFSQDQVRALVDYVDRGGRLLLVGDPTRFNVVVEETEFDFSFFIANDDIPLNSVANEFDIIFNGDYLYNTAESEGNYRNIILKEAFFADAALTAGLETVVFYGSHSLQTGPEATALLGGDDNTWSTATDRPGGLTLAALGGGDRVLALGDINFMTNPYHTVYDNSRFIAHIADFLVEPGRGFILGDFPFFYRQPINLIYAGAPELGPDAFDEVIALQNAFRRVERDLTLAAEPQDGHDTLTLGLYNQAEDVAAMLDAAGVELVIDPPIVAAANGDGSDAGADAVRRIRSGLGNVQMSGTALILLDESDGRRSVVVLGASKEGLESAVDRLLNVVPYNADYALDGCLLQDGLALCPTGVADEPVEAELVTSGTPADTAGESDAETGGESGDTIAEVDATLQGDVGLDDTVEGTLDEGESHAWVFGGGPTTIDILLETDDTVDGVLELYDPDYQLLASVDETLEGEDEQLSAVAIPDDGDYTIVVRDFFGNSGGYSLTVTEGDASAGGGGGDGLVSVFILADDDGEAATDGFTSAGAIEDLLSGAYDVTVWSSVADGPLQEDTLSGYDLVIWTSGDYRNENAVADNDTLIVFNYLLSGGDLLLSGATPTFMDLDSEAVTLASLADLEVTDDSSELLDGFEPGAILALDQVYQATVLNEADITGGEEGSVLLFVRGAESEMAGNAAGVAFSDSASDADFFLLGAPFQALPAGAQETLLNNLMVWFVNE